MFFFTLTDYIPFQKYEKLLANKHENNFRKVLFYVQLFYMSHAKKEIGMSLTVASEQEEAMVVKVKLFN